MQRFALSICSRCRLSLSRPSQPNIWVNGNQLDYRLQTPGFYFPRRFRSGQGGSKFQKRPKEGFGGAWVGGGYTVNQQKPPHIRKRLKRRGEGDAGLQVSLAQLPEFLETRVAAWSRISKVSRRLKSFGIPEEDIPILLQAFVADMERGLLKHPGIEEKYTLKRFEGFYTKNNYGRVDDVLTNIFYAWASDPVHQHFLDTIVPPSTLRGIIQLREATDLSYPIDHYPDARSIRRKFIMHVGPTNSGKTHMALRALAAAGSGVYAGPLRLLAHEVWERLNKGQIVPLGMDAEADGEPDTDTNIDAVGDKTAQPTLKKEGNPKCVRECNLLTGEESKVVSDYASLMSCTIEMLSTSRLFDVAVLDEIQMIADQDRGGAWTKAVLGVFAKEVHLCGEETAIPVIEAMLKETGDELVINHYQRLTPLVVQEQSLEGDLKRIQKGDCIVTFSRSGIFALKRQVEELTGMRCAVAYGRLPPEIRSEQAALFNDPESGYDVMVGSDAIGMGLNLKIKRVIFEVVHKFNGTEEIQLSDSQIKQIAGRAGRYGLHGEPGGFATTLHPNDLPILRKALNAPTQPLDRAYVQETMYTTAQIVHCLPLHAPTLTIREAYSYVSRLVWPYHFRLAHGVDDMCEFIDTMAGSLTLEDKSLLMSGPVPWRDAEAMATVAEFYRQYCTQTRVRLIECLKKGALLSYLEDVESCMKTQSPSSSHQKLNALEGLHKVLVFYMWMHMRSPVGWHDHDEVSDLKARTERALDWCLQGISWHNKQRHLPDIAVLRRKKEDQRIAFIDQEFIRKRAETRRNQKRAGSKIRSGR